MRRLFPALLLIAACAREGHVLERQAAHRPAPTPADVGQMCAEAFLKVEGLSPAMTKEQRHALLVRKFGSATASMLMNGIDAKHVRVRRNELFMPTATLCTMKGLPSQCTAACREAFDVGKASPP
jgi:hypothetical protein